MAYSDMGGLAFQHIPERRRDLESASWHLGKSKDHSTPENQRAESAAIRN